jgi:hypothetical protein
MRAKLKDGVALAGAQVVDLASWREGHRPQAEPWLIPTDRPGMDFNEMHHCLRAAAMMAREGRMGAKEIANLLDRLSVNAQAACRASHDIEFRLLRAERVLSRQFGNIEGKALTTAIHRASIEAGKANRREEREARRRERNPVQT